MAGPGKWQPLAWVQRDSSGNRRAWTSEYDARLERLRQWRRHVRRVASTSIQRVRDDFPWRLIPLAALTLVVAVAYVQWRMPPEADPNYVQARRIVEQYELGKSWEMLDYNHPIYARALDLLSRVDRGSISAHEAKRYSARLVVSIEDFKKRRARERERVNSKLRHERNRQLSLESAQRATSGVGRAAVFQHECEEELHDFEDRQDALGEMRR